MPPDRFTHTITTTATPQRVWSALQEPETWGNIAGVDRVFDVVHDPEGVLRRYKFLATAGPRAYEGRSETVEVEAPRRMVVDVNTAEVVGSITATVEDCNPPETQVTVEVRLEARGMLAALFFPLVARAVGAGLPRHLDEFRQHVEG